MNNAYIRKIASLALAEDIGRKDITTNALVPTSQKARANIVVKSQGVLCGLNIARQVFRFLDPKLKFKKCAEDGQKAPSQMVIAQIQGSARALLSAERVALNFLSHLSGIASKTFLFVQAVKPYKSIILDTRKTMPLWRRLERYAVRCGGGGNHRYDLYSMAMIKDNHKVVCRNRPLSELVSLIKNNNTQKIVVEADNFTELRQALRTPADIVLLDNMSVAQVQRAVKLRDQTRSKILLEASGGITLNNVRRYAATGVERISVGALTHSHQAMDISLEFI